MFKNDNPIYNPLLLKKKKKISLAYVCDMVHKKKRHSMAQFFWKLVCIYNIHIMVRDKGICLNQV